MRTTILSAAALLAVAAGQAQTGFGTQISVTSPTTDDNAARTAGTTAATVVPASEALPAGRSEWLAPFDAVEVDATVDIRFVEVPATEAPRIVYDTKGDDNTKFRAEVRNGVLHIRERADMHRTARTQVTVNYNTLRSLTITDANATFANTLAAPMFDLTVGARSSVDIHADIQDLMMELSGDSRAKLTGAVRYLTLSVSTGRVDALDLRCESAVVTAKNKAEVTVDVADRLEAKAVTSGSIFYKRMPVLLRTSQSLLAGTIGRIEQE